MLLVLGAVACACTSTTPRAVEDRAEPAPADPLPVDPDSEAAKRSPGPSTVGEVMIQRTMCYGECPSYIAFIHTDGSVLYYGRQYVDVEGLRTGQVATEDAKALLSLAMSNGYFDTKTEYRDNKTDQATVYSSVVAHAQRHGVESYGRVAPPPVAVVELAADALLERVAWDPEPSPSRLPHPRACQRLGAEIASRCEGFLEFTEGPGECPLWLDLWDRLPRGKVDESEANLVCDRHYRSLLMAPPRPSAPLPPPPSKLPPSCVDFVAGPVADCHEALGANLAGCGHLSSTIEQLQVPLEPGAPGIRDFFCSWAMR